MGKRILVADDAACMRLMLRNILTLNGFEVIAEASNGDEAIEAYKDYKPDLVTMDITMPKKDGINAIKKIKEMDPDAKIIVVSAMGQKAMVIDAIKAGAKHFLIKPLEATKVITVVSKMLGD